VETRDDPASTHYSPLLPTALCLLPWGRKKGRKDKFPSFCGGLLSFRCFCPSSLWVKRFPEERKKKKKGKGGVRASSQIPRIWSQGVLHEAASQIAAGRRGGKKGGKKNLGAVLVFVQAGDSGKSIVMLRGRGGGRRGKETSNVRFVMPLSITIGSGKFSLSGSWKGKGKKKKRGKK